MRRLSLILAILLVPALSMLCMEVHAQGGKGKGKDKSEKHGKMNKAAAQDEDAKDAEEEAEAEEDSGRRGKGPPKAGKGSRPGNRPGKGVMTEEDEPGQGMRKGKGGKPTGRDMDKGRGMMMEGGTARGRGMSGRGLERSVDEIENQMAKEINKHRERTARIKRTREMLKEKGNEEGAEEAAGLLEKENARHERRMVELRERKQEFIKRRQERTKEIEGREGQY